SHWPVRIAIRAQVRSLAAVCRPLASVRRTARSWAGRAWISGDWAKMWSVCSLMGLLCRCGGRVGPVPLPARGSGPAGELLGLLVGLGGVGGLGGEVHDLVALGHEVEGGLELGGGEAGGGVALLGHGGTSCVCTELRTP